MEKKELLLVIDYVSTRKTLSCANLQLRFKKGYNWAGRMMDYLEDKKLVGPFSGVRDRDVIGSAELFEEIKNVEKNG